MLFWDIVALIARIREDAGKCGPGRDFDAGKDRLERVSIGGSPQCFGVNDELAAF